jgi:hypothetical protein
MRYPGIVTFHAIGASGCPVYQDFPDLHWQLN